MCTKVLEASVITFTLEMETLRLRNVKLLLQRVGRGWSPAWGGRPTAAL